jgi:SAM-dependent methyltransferase
MEQDFYRAYYELEGRHWWFLGRRKLFLRIIEEQYPPSVRPLAVLDFGCGTGAFLEHLERFGTVSAVDADPSAVSFCHARGRSEVVVAPSGAPLPFPDDAFDLVTSLDVIEHIDDDVAALAELRRVLRPGGRLLIAVPAYAFLWGKQDEVSHHRRRYTARTLTRALGEAGFGINARATSTRSCFPRSRS